MMAYLRSKSAAVESSLEDLRVLCRRGVERLAVKVAQKSVEEKRYPWDGQRSAALPGTAPDRR